MAVVSAPISSPATLGRPAWRDLDWPLLGLVLLLSLWGLMTVASATRPSDDAAFTRSISTSLTTRPGATAASGSKSATSVSRLPEVWKQAAWIVVGLCLMGVLASGDYGFLMQLQGWIYTLNLLALAAVLFLPAKFVPVTNGAKSWIVLGPVSVQLSEFAKVALLISLGGFLARRQDRMRDASTVLWSLVYLAPPLLLVLKQPDFGTVLAMGTIWLGMMFFGGARLWHIGLVLALAALAFGVAWQQNKLKQYQKDRLAVVFDTGSTSHDKKSERDKSKGDPAYQVRQSQIAIGGGGLTGQGYERGMMTGGNFVPEKQNDFIFAVVGEELGFVGASILVGAFCLLLLRCVAVAATSDTFFGVLIAGGYAFLLAFHALVNIGMTMRVMPSTGVPLPFFSYGGSSYVAFAMGAGLLQSVAMRARRAIVV